MRAFVLGPHMLQIKRGWEEFRACKQLGHSVKSIVWKNLKPFCESVLRIKLGRITLHPWEGFTSL